MILFFLLLLLIEYCSNIITMAKLQEFHAVSLEHWGLMIINPNLGHTTHGCTWLAGFEGGIS